MATMYAIVGPPDSFGVNSSTSMSVRMNLIVKPVDGTETVIMDKVEVSSVNILLVTDFKTSIVTAAQSWASERGHTLSRILFPDGVAVTPI